MTPPPSALPALTGLALVAGGLYLHHLSNRSRSHPATWTALLTRRRRVRTYLLSSVLFLLSALTIVLSNLYRAMLPQFGDDTPWAFAPFLLTSIALVLIPPTRLLIRRWRRSRRTGSSG